MKTAPQRRRLPNRRPAVTEEISVSNNRLTATIGFDPDGHPAEIEDTAVAISVALQYGISARALGRSVGRVPETLGRSGTLPASPIGAALDLLASYDRGER
jgi:hypothetical protein